MLPDKIYIANNLKRDGENIFYFGQTTRKVETAIRELNEDKANSGRFELVKAYWVKMDKGVKEVVLKKFQNKNIFKEGYFQCDSKKVISKIEKLIKPMGALDHETYKADDHIEPYLKRFVKNTMDIEEWQTEEDGFVEEAYFYYTHDDKALILEHFLKKLMSNTSGNFVIDCDVTIIHEIEGFHTGLIHVFFEKDADVDWFENESSENWLSCQIPNFVRMYVDCFYKGRLNGDKFDRDKRHFIISMKKFCSIWSDSDFDFYDALFRGFDSYEALFRDFDSYEALFRDGSNPCQLELNFLSIMDAKFFQEISYEWKKENPKFQLNSIFLPSFDSPISPEDGEAHNNKIKLKWLGLEQSPELSKALYHQMRQNMLSIQ